MRFAREVLALAGAPPPISDKPFDWVVIDTPPAISLFTRAALCAADFVIAPARSRPSSQSGILNMLKTMDSMGDLRGTPPNLVGCLLTHWQEDQHSTETYPQLETLFDSRRSRILANYIPFDPTVEKLHGPTQHRARDAYDLVTQEVLDYVQRS
jgi:cellulose biosynthesis protein BcsQ